MTEATQSAERGERALVLGGGGARAAYQVGVLKYIGEQFPGAQFPVLTGVSAGSINTAYLANNTTSMQAAADELVDCWNHICTERIFRARSVLELVRTFWRSRAAHDQSLLDAAPLRDYLASHLATEEGRLLGVGENLSDGWLRALAVSTSNYQTSQTVTWVQGCAIRDWERPNRVGQQTHLTIDHVMASAAIPLLFPAVQIGADWYGDGGVRLLDPLAPAIHLGGTRLLAISTRYARSQGEAQAFASGGYPSVLQVAGLLMNAVFLDVLEHDAAILRRINRLVRRIPDGENDLPLQPIDLLVIRPSVDLGALANDHDFPWTGTLNALRVLHQAGTGNPDWLSMLLFTPEYVNRLIEIGQADAAAQHESIAAFFETDPPAEVRLSGAPSRTS